MYAKLSLLSPRITSNYLVNWDYKWQTLEFLKRLEIDVILNSHFWQFFLFGTIVFRKKHGLVRNDFLDCMIELRQGDKDEVKGDVQSEEKANTGDTFSTLEYNGILRVTEY